MESSVYERLYVLNVYEIPTMIYVTGAYILTNDLFNESVDNLITIRKGNKMACY